MTEMHVLFYLHFQFLYFTSSNSVIMCQRKHTPKRLVPDETMSYFQVFWSRAELQETSCGSG